MTREYTTKLLALVEDGAFDAYSVLRDALTYMSEDEVKDLCESEGYSDEWEEEEEAEEFEFNDEEEVNDAFEGAFYLSLNWDDIPAVREAFSYYVDSLQRDGRISDELANSVTLRNDD